MIVCIAGKCRKILTKHQKIKVVCLFVMMLAGGFLEMFSVSLVLPFVDAVMNPQKLVENPIVEVIFSALGMECPQEILVFMAVVLATVYVLKNIYLVWETNVRVKFVYNCMFGVQKRLFSDYLQRPYEYYLGVNSGEVLRIINHDTKEAFLLLETLLTFFTELVVAIMLVLTLLIISPFMTVVMGIMIGLSICIILKVVRPVVQRAGNMYQDGLAKMSQWTLQGIHGIKDVKISQKEHYFENSFAKCGEEYVQAVKSYVKWVQMPRFLIEAVSMGTFFVGSALMISIKEDAYSLLPIISTIAMAAIRLLPAASRMSTQITDMAYREPMLDKMLDNLKSIRKDIYIEHGQNNRFDEKKIADLSADISLERISYRYPNTEKLVLDEASLKIEKGASVGIVGASGSGKTTVVDIMLGLLEPEEGEILVDGVGIGQDKIGWLSQVGYIPQSIFLLDDSIRTNVAFGHERKEVNDDDVWIALREAALEDFVRGLPEGLDTNLGERGVRLSGGQKQRIGIARALYENPSVLVFDEATSALDSETEMAIMESIARLQRAKTLIIIAHRMTTLENCDMIFKVEDGTIRRIYYRC